MQPSQEQAYISSKQQYWMSKYMLFLLHYIVRATL